MKFIIFLLLTLKYTYSDHVTEDLSNNMLVNKRLRHVPILKGRKLSGTDPPSGIVDVDSGDEILNVGDELDNLVDELENLVNNTDTSSGDVDPINAVNPSSGTDTSSGDGCNSCNLTKY